MLILIVEGPVAPPSVYVSVILAETLRKFTHFVCECIADPVRKDEEKMS